jgi:Mg2+ and Co2+ transporter CorA
MEIRTFEDLINWVRDMHSFLARSMHESAHGNTNEQASALLTYLADHEQELVRITDEFERQADRKTLDTRLYDYMKHKPVKVNDPADTHFASLGFEDICKEIFRFHDQVIDLYDSLAGKAEILEAKELMDALKQMEENEAMRLARQIDSSRDI